MPGFDNDVVYAGNVDFRGVKPRQATLVTDGQLLIGSTALNAGSTHINVGTLTSPDSSITIGYSSPNITVQLAGSSSFGKTITGDSGGALSPSGNNWNILGQQASTTPVMDTIGSGSTLKIEDRTWLTSLVVDSAGTVGLRGTFQTIASAISAASSGQTIFIRPGTYTENLTLKAGVNLTAFGSDSSLNATGKVIISGTCTMTTAGSVTISGIQLQTNSAALLAVTGSAASVVNLNNCFLNCTNNTGITFSAANTSAQININNCYGDIGTTGITYFSDSSTGTLNINYTDLANSGNSTTASTKSAGLITGRFASIRVPLTYSSSNILSSFIECNATTNAVNTTAITTSGTGTFTIDGGRVDAGSASAISAGAGTTVACRNCIVFSTNTNALTGAGTLTFVGILFSGTSSQSNVTTQTGGAASGLTQGTAPSAGFIGEQIRATVAAGSAVNLPNNTGTNITSISLTAGIWDVSVIAQISCTGNFTNINASVSTTSATLGTGGDNAAGQNYAAAQNNQTLCLVVPAYRITLSAASTTVYFVAQTTFSTGASSGYGRISATRVG